MTAYGDKVWLAQYQHGQPATITPEYDSALSMFHATVARSGDTDAIRYFDCRISFAELDALTDAFAAGIITRGFQPGGRVGIFLQNVPQFVIAQVGTWKAGGIAVSINPMNKARELDELLTDSGATVLVALQSLYRDVASQVLAKSAVRVVLTTSELDFQTRNEPAVLGGAERIACPNTTDLLDLLEAHRGVRPPEVALGLDDLAFLTYTSGTTGPPKGAMITHRNVVFNARSYRDWVGISEDDVVLGVAPLFHITGLIAHVALSLLAGAPLVLMHRFDPALTLDVIEAEGATFTAGSITVFIALMNVPEADGSKLTSLRKIYSGGAPIPPSTVAAFRDKFGQYIHNVYGLTETTSPSHMGPFGTEAPVDPDSAALSVGVPIYDTVVRIVDESGAELPPGHIGELVTEGPQVVSGYWHKPDETANAIPGGALHTGDVGYMNDEGWFFIVDRKKDQINAGGYKVWPREVEDVLYEHPAVREAAVIGVPDEYRGETVKAFVSLKSGATATGDDIVAFTKQRLAAYKYPRQVEILDDIPMTASGKVLRRELRTNGWRGQQRDPDPAPRRVGVPDDHQQPGT